MKHILTMFLVSFLGIGTIQAQTKILGRKVFDRGIQRLFPIRNMRMTIINSWCWRRLKVPVIRLK